jgi:myo-inositol-1(or 4)-monophosphatase
MDKALRHRVNAARVAVQNQVGFFNNLKGQVAFEWKADDTRVTFADFAISEKIFTVLRRAFSADDFLSEERVSPDERQVLSARYAWILDPIDGTNNYALGMPCSAISLALLKEGLPVYGFIYDGGTGELLEGGKGHSLKVNGRKVIPPVREFDKKSGIVAVHFPLPAGRTGDFARLLETYSVRSLGSAALHLAYTALGRLDGSLEEGARIWDIAAAVCLMQAAGKDIRFLGQCPFPFRSFAMKDPFIRYMAGNLQFLDAVENWLG